MLIQILRQRVVVIINLMNDLGTTLSRIACPRRTVRRGRPVPRDRERPIGESGWCSLSFRRLHEFILLLPLKVRFLDTVGGVDERLSVQGPARTVKVVHIVVNERHGCKRLVDLGDRVS